MCRCDVDTDPDDDDRAPQHEAENTRARFDRRDIAAIASEADRVRQRSEMSHGPHPGTRSESEQQFADDESDINRGE